jgi:hypothetical protein
MYTACNGRLALRMTIPFAISIRSAAVTYFRGVPGKHAVLKITFMKQHIYPLHLKSWQEGVSNAA